MEGKALTTLMAAVALLAPVAGCAASGEVVETSINTAEVASSGDLEGSATLSSFDGSKVVVRGEYVVPTPCHEATILDADVEDGTLLLVIGAEETSEVCAQVMSEMAYEATVTVDGPVDRLRVYHGATDRAVLDEDL